MNDAFEKQAQEIAEQVYSVKGTQFGVGQVGVHTHNNVDSPLLSPTSLTNVKVLSAQSGNVLNGATVSNIQAPVTIYPTPIILAAAPTGVAPEGTMVLAYNSVGPVVHLYAYVQGAWYKIAPLL